MNYEFLKKAVTESTDKIYLFKEKENCKCDESESINCCPSTTNTPC